jgi:hypothetical protein
MHYQITKLDKRHSHHERFVYMIEFSKRPGPVGIRTGVTTPGTGALDFDHARRWFGEIYGRSQEADLQLRIDTEAQWGNRESTTNSHWAYHTEFREYRIYANAPETAWFQLKFPNHT